jgi:hypothetical protein
MGPGPGICGEHLSEQTTRAVFIQSGRIPTIDSNKGNELLKRRLAVATQELELTKKQLAVQQQLEELKRKSSRSSQRSRSRDFMCESDESIRRWMEPNERGFSDREHFERSEFGISRNQQGPNTLFYKKQYINLCYTIINDNSRRYFSTFSQYQCNGQENRNLGNKQRRVSQGISAETAN